MADVAMHEQAIGIDDDGKAISRDPSGAYPVSVDTSAVPRDSHPPASSPADLAKLERVKGSAKLERVKGLVGCAHPLPRSRKRRDRYDTPL